MKNKLKVIVLENCPYSIAAAELLTNHNIEFKKIMVNQETKSKYKTDKISTFPQIYIINNGNELLLGGYSDLEEIINILNSSTKLNIIKNKLNKKYLIYKDNKKIILRIIEIFSSKYLR
jgi:glutaredoxin